MINLIKYYNSNELNYLYTKTCNYQDFFKYKNVMNGFTQKVIKLLDPQEKYVQNIKN